MNKREKGKKKRHQNSTFSGSCSVSCSSSFSVSCWCSSAPNSTMYHWGSALRDSVWCGFRICSFHLVLLVLVGLLMSSCWVGADEMFPPHLGAAEWGIYEPSLKNSQWSSWKCWHHVLSCSWDFSLQDSSEIPLEEKKNTTPPKPTEEWKYNIFRNSFYPK